MLYAKSIGVGPGRQIDYVALGREHEHLVGKEIDFQLLHEVLVVDALALVFDERTHPFELAVDRIRAGDAALVLPVRRDAVFCRVVHFHVRICTSNGMASRPSTTVCRDWYMLGLGVEI